MSDSKKARKLNFVQDAVDVPKFLAMFEDRFWQVQSY